MLVDGRGQPALTIAFTGGGTGGHIYPGLAVIARLRRDYRVVWIGSAAGMDRAVVEAAGIEFYGIPAGRLRRYFSFKTVPDLFRVLGGFFTARSVLKRLRPALLFSKGGFVSVPPCAAAAWLKIPVYTHESDLSPGLATRINLRFVRRTGGRMFTAYAVTAAFLPPACRSLVTVSGNPVRPGFRSANPVAEAAAGRAFLGLGEGERILLVLGASQGSVELNTLVREALPELTKYYVVVHQTGPGNEGAEPSGRYRPYAYFREEMPQVLAAADLVLSRAGAGTVWENATCGKPMILLPLRGSGTRGDQVENAEFFERTGAALVLRSRSVSMGNPGSVTADDLAALVRDLAENPEQAAALAAAAARVALIDGAALIAHALDEAVLALAGGGAP
ncbi:MAG: UDP-N-acetylglucosamine--N-acetylmuramyl-(pentapeptide) pyrophosphoryl-undecaprenol N-acetylglucosamine transferase [Treponema sp.]|jgi:UDP-N-acetylglucosamine--N-acetylmuramyl-(pentapeptide) pyrophosphoryl-undecaprenol N-acetylglucosamine transferase|nr:UDP-N-acetylglucosamine--N-acetylmuramyl-(pentapeptide) pyrophosphoryl-undecaprenol N-acetylglucosamine transferase [Treponema sp.]